MFGVGRQRVAPPLATAVPVIEDRALVEPPDDLSDDVKACWRVLAPFAITERTLTASKVPGFRKLCQRWVMCGCLEARIAVLGPHSAEADRVLRRLEVWEKMLDSALGNFKLRAFGKPEAPEKPKVHANPFGALAAK